MKLGNYVNPTLLELSFREFLTDVREDESGLFDGFDRAAFVHEFKNLVHFSFQDQNPFDTEYFQHGRVTFRRSILNNRITEKQWRDRFRNEPEYTTKLDAVCIPLFPYISGRLSQARLVIAAPTDVPVQIAVQTRVAGSDFWGTHHCTVHTALDTISSLI